MITGAKPQIVGSAAPTNPKIEPAPSTPPATSTTSGQPLRAVPLIARPVIIPTESPAEEGETPNSDPTAVEAPENEEEDEEAATRNDGNQFPRPLN